MRNDVRTLIGALTTERNSLDRAITALKAMSDAGTVAPSAKPSTTRQPWRNKPRAVISPESKAAIVARMATAVNMSVEARAIEADLGVKATTILTGWKVWRTMPSVQQASNGSGNLQ